MNLKEHFLKSVFSADKFPHPGMVIRFYREKMVYTDQNGVVHHWTQQDLANALGVSEITVRLIETKCKGLDSMKRRQFVADLLNIPPVLLGLSTLDELSSYFDTMHPYPSSSSSQKGTTLSLFEDALGVYWESHYLGTPVVRVPTVLAWMHHIRQTVDDHQQTLLCEWSLLLANMYADQRKFLEAFSLLNDVLSMARGNNDKELEAATLYCLGHIHLDHHTFSDASDALSKALSMVKYVNIPLCGAITQTAALAFAFTSQTATDRTASERMLMQVSKLTDTAGHDPYHVRFNYGRYLLELGDAQIVLKRHEAALETLDEADNLIGLDQQRRKGYINILRAEVMTSMQQPRWDVATDQLTRAVELSSSIESFYNMEYIGRLSSRIQMSPYAKSYEAVQLHRTLHNYQVAHQL